MPTKIAWTEETWNPITGCTKISPGCKNCYAERMSKRLAGRFGYPKEDPFRVTLHSDKINQPLRWRKPRRVFVCSMGDLFHPDVPDPWCTNVFDVMAHTPQHTYQVLTKRPGNMREFLKGYYSHQYRGFPDIPYPNVWLGVTTEAFDQAIERIPILLQTPAVVRFVSIEPMLEPIILTPYLVGLNVFLGRALNWVIVGCESGPDRRTVGVEHIEDLVTQCQTTGVPVFVKQIEINGQVNHNPKDWPVAVQIQEYPEINL